MCIKGKKNIKMKLIYFESIKFVFIGVVNTLFGYSCYSIFLFLGFNYLISAFFSTMLGVFFNYFSIGKIVFNNSGFSINKSLKFVFIYLIIYVMNILFIKLFVFMQFNNYMAGMLALPFIALFSFALNKYFVFVSNTKERLV